MADVEEAAEEQNHQENDVEEQMDVDQEPELDKYDFFIHPYLCSVFFVRKIFCFHYFSRAVLLRPRWKKPKEIRNMCRNTTKKL